MTSDQITELKRLLERATPGPWHNHNPAPYDSRTIRISNENGGSIAAQSPCGTKADFALIVALRNSAPALLARLESLERHLQRCVSVMEKNIYPKPDVGPKHPWSVLRDARAALATKGTNE